MPAPRRPARWRSGLASCHAGQLVALAVPQYRLGIHARQVCASVTPGPTSSSPAKNDVMSAGVWLCQAAASVLLGQLLAQGLVIEASHGDDQAAAGLYEPCVSRGHHPGGIGV